MMKLKKLLAEKKYLVSDGAWGTQIAKYGLDSGICPELFNVEEPDMLRTIGESYVDAGSDIILTNTFGGSPQKLSKYGLENRLEELNEAGVRLSVEASNGRALVFASIGPTGEFLAPLGLTTENEMIESFARQVKAFEAGGADAVLIETMTDIGEITCALKAVKDNSDLEVVCSMTFDKGVKGYATMMGVTPDRAAAELEEAGADVVGSNCGSGIDNIIEVARIMKPSTDLPLWFKPNAGLPELVSGETVYKETPEEMAARVPELIEAGANIVGGCCGTTPEHIAEIRNVIDTL
ncbi:homocysteine S-methyltransferase family protein [Candidatus Latescibacterota bacterium]